MKKVDEEARARAKAVMKEAIGDGSLDGWDDGTVYFYFFDKDDNYVQKSVTEDKELTEKLLEVCRQHYAEQIKK